MSPVNNPHKGITSLINELLFEQLLGKVNVQSQSPISIDKYSHPEPDITIAYFKKHRYINVDTRPEDIHFLIEVSDSTLQKDRTIKRELYAKAGIPEYWIINIPDEQIEVFKQLKDGDYQKTLILKKGEMALFESLNFQIAVKDIFF
jgi:Uma2 family endonuclease